MHTKLKCSNAASTLLGVVLIPLSGIAWEILPGSVLYTTLNMGTFNPVTWGATFLLAVFINAGLEWFVIQKLYKTMIGKCGFWIMAGANALSVGVAFGSLLIAPAEL